MKTDQAGRIPYQWGQPLQHSNWWGNPADGELFSQTYQAHCPAKTQMGAHFVTWSTQVPQLPTCVKLQTDHKSRTKLRQLNSLSWTFTFKRLNCCFIPIPVELSLIKRIADVMCKHQSEARPWPCPFMISGARKSAIPQIEKDCSSDICSANLKSASCHHSIAQNQCHNCVHFIHLPVSNILCLWDEGAPWQQFRPP